MNIRDVMKLRANHISEIEEARAEKLKAAGKFARFLGYKRVTWKILGRLGYNIWELGYRGSGIGQKEKRRTLNEGSQS